MTAEDVDGVRSGFVVERPDAIAEVRGWIRATVRTQWSLVDLESFEQDVLLELLMMARAGRIHSDSNFKSFVYRVARVRAIDAFRSQRLRQHASMSERHETADTTAETSAAAIQRREREELVKYIYQTLTPACRKILRWLFGEERSHAWIAHRLDVSEGAARVRAHRCLERARKISKRFDPPFEELST